MIPSESTGRNAGHRTRGVPSRQGAHNSTGFGCECIAERAYSSPLILANCCKKYRIHTNTADHDEHGALRPLVCRTASQRCAGVLGILFIRIHCILYHNQHLARVRKTLNQNLPDMLSAALFAEEHQAAADPERLGGIEPNRIYRASGKDGSAALNLPQDAEGWAQGFR